MDGLCECGCGQPAPLAKQTNKRFGHVKGQPVRFIHNHHRNGKSHTSEAREKMSESVKAAHAANPSWHRPFTAEERMRGTDNNRREKHWNWKGGRQQYGRGYIGILMPDHPNANSRGVVAEHRLVMERHLGRYLLPGEVIHHLNGDKKDNRIENLKVLDHGVHTSFHNQERALRRENRRLRALIAEMEEHERG